MKDLYINGSTLRFISSSRLDIDLMFIPPIVPKYYALIPTHYYVDRL